MKKVLPLILLIVGVLVAVGAYFFVVRGNRNDGDLEDISEETALLDVALVDRPVLSLTPRSDGHWLDMKVEKLMVPGAESMDYELIYSLPDDRQQGVPGTVKLDGQEEIEAELLLGSESSGKFRYDEGVEGGMFTLRFRNSEGKLLAKFESDFKLYTNTEKLNSTGNDFTVSLDGAQSNYYVVMDTIGVPSEPPGELALGPYGLFSSGNVSTGSVEVTNGKVYRFDGSEWTEEVGGDSFDIGIYVAVN